MNNKCTALVPYEPQVFDVKTAQAAVIGAVGIGLGYSLCFGGGEIYCQLSSLVFAVIAVFFAVFVLKRFDRLKNKGALTLIVPVILISGFNCVFSLSVMNYINMFSVYALIMAMCALAQREKGEDCSLAAYEAVGILLCRPVKAMDAFKRASVLREYEQGSGKNAMGLCSGGFSSMIIRILTGVAVSVPVLIIIGALLCSADRVFARLMVNMLSGVNILQIIFKIMVFLTALCYSFGCIYSIKVRGRVKAAKPKKGDGIVLNSFFVMLNIMFAVFCYVQIAYVFCGGFMTLPEGVIYSEYAREGFFQLLFVTIINFGCIIGIVSVFRDNVKKTGLKVQLTALCLFTGVLIVSSFYRMSLYIGTFGYTVLRNQVLCFLLIESILIIYTIYAVISEARLYRLVGFYFAAAAAGVIAVNLFAGPYAVGRLNESRLVNGEQGSFVLSYDNLFVYDRICKNEAVSSDIKEKARQAILDYKADYDNYRADKWQNFKLIDIVNKRILDEY